MATHDDIIITLGGACDVMCRCPECLPNPAMPTTEVRDQVYYPYEPRSKHGKDKKESK